MTRRHEAEIPAGSVTSKSLFVMPDADAPVPAVLILPQWSGRSPAEDSFAEKLAQLGYAGIACDLYGDGRRGTSQAENQALMQVLLDDRAELRRRLLDLMEAVGASPDIDSDRLGVAGFCFGGLCALDLARAGADIRCAASFHGLFSPPEGLDKPKIKATIAVYHGWDDPMVPPSDVTSLAKELSDRQADWYLMGFGHAVHAFTRPDAGDDTSAGIAYDAHADRRSWRDFTDLLEDRLQ
ncbi:carboxymethylenebutenolidase [Pacificimonas flava]|uniref:Carboxymethylenebutenolidase n=2 Tax=Pacificimonas TaxID=1960290 RepID=A0A219B4L6_9SPHN|nr:MULTISPECIES: dienelactone hydrolase family protein [Pacificimonas]MBZ6379507.1 dienelactone hydrolase family protein [Pacificimonas aurantium]OWV33305.1 carboxymethylenebutenolidase [Pacificimonas flava]